MRKIELHINSYLDRLISEVDSSSKQFTVLLEGMKEIKIYPDEKKVTLMLQSIELPNVLYNIPYYQSTVWFKWDIDGVNTLEHITVNTERVYTTPVDLIDEINSLIVAHPVLNGIQFSYTDSEKKVSVTNTSGKKIKLISSFRYGESNEIYNDMMDRLGFIQDMRNIIVNNGQTIKGNGLIRMIRSNCFYLVCDQIGSSYSQCIVPRPGFNSGILARLSTSDFGTLSQLSYPAVVDFQLLNSSSIRNLTFKLMDEEMQPTDLGQFPITMTLIITIE